MDENYDEEISRLKENLDRAKNLRIRAEARLEQLVRQKTDLIKEIKALGVEPEELDSEINRLRAEIEELISKANSLLPDEL